MAIEISTRGLKRLVKEFDTTNENSIYCYNWTISKGGYDTWFELYFEGIPVVECVLGVLHNNCLSEKDYKRVSNIIVDELDGIKAAISPQAN